MVEGRGHANRWSRLVWKLCMDVEDESRVEMSEQLR